MAISHNSMQYLIHVCVKYYWAHLSMYYQIFPAMVLIVSKVERLLLLLIQALQRLSNLIRMLAGNVPVQSIFTSSWI